MSIHPGVSARSNPRDARQCLCVHGGSGPCISPFEINERRAADATRDCRRRVVVISRLPVLGTKQAGVESLTKPLRERRCTVIRARDRARPSERRGGALGRPRATTSRPGFEEWPQMCARPGAWFPRVAANDAGDECKLRLSEAQHPDGAAVAPGTRLEWFRVCKTPIRMAGLMAAAFALTFAGAALAAQPKGKHVEPPKLTHPMQVVIVSDGRPGCEPNCAEWISAEGEIGRDTPARFSRVFNTLGHKKLPIFISSTGGSVNAALAIGREIRKRGLDVAVERTLFQKCEPSPSTCDRRTLKDGDKGRPEPIAAYCASSCAFILAAGIQRVVPVYGFVGVHEIIAFQTYNRVWRTYRVQRRIVNGQPAEVSRQL